MKKYLIEAFGLMGGKMTSEQADMFVKYHKMLTVANHEMNLTRVSDDFREACDRNYLDSLTLLGHIKRVSTLIDVGSGAGFPGIPLAIMRPDISVTLIDSLAKRVDFLNGVINELKLNAKAVHIRCEEAASKSDFREKFDIATARAVSQMNILSEWLLPFVRVGGRMLAMKGPSALEETSDAESAIQALGGRLEGVYDADVPGRDWSHKTVVIEKTGSTPPRFPRKPGIAEKRPIRNA